MVVNVQRKDKSQNMKVIMNKICKLNTFNACMEECSLVASQIVFRKISSETNVTLMKFQEIFVEVIYLDNQ